MVFTFITYITFTLKRATTRLQVTTNIFEYSILNVTDLFTKPFTFADHIIPFLTFSYQNICTLDKISVL